MELLIPITKSTPLTTTISKILDHFTLDPHVQLTEITKAQPVTIQAEGGACPRAVSIVEIAVEKKVKVGGRTEGDRKGKSKSRARMLKKREERRAKREEKSEIRREHHIKMRASTVKQEREDSMLWLSEQLKQRHDRDGVKELDENIETPGSKRKREGEVSDDSDDLFDTASYSSSSSSDDEDAKIHLVPSISISISFSRLVRDGWTPQLRGAINTVLVRNMNVFPDRNDPFGSQSTLQLSFTSAHRVPRKTYSKRGRTRDKQKATTPGSGSAASAITARTNSKVARLKAKNDSEIDVFEFDEDEGHESWVQGRMTKQRTKRESASDGMEIESSSSNRRSSPSPSAPVNSHYFGKGSKSKARITPEGKNMEVPSAPRKSILSPSKAVLKEFVNEAWKFRDESKPKEYEGDDTLTKRPSKVRIMSKAEEIIVKPVSEVRHDDGALRHRSRTKTKSAVKQEKTATLISSHLNREQTGMSKESQLQKPFTIANDSNIIPHHNTSSSLPARMKRIYLSSDNGDDLSTLEVAPPKITASKQFTHCLEDEFEDDDIYDMTGPISTSTPNMRTSTAGLQSQADKATVKVPETKKLFTVKTEIGRLAISPVKNNRSDATKRVTLGGIPDLSMPLTTQNTIAPMKKSRSGISVYRDVPGISPVSSASELEHNTAANATLNAGIKTCEKKQSGLQSVVQSHVRMGTLSKSDKKSIKQPISTIEVSSHKRAMSRYGRRVIYADDDEDELAL
ncbi:hypothetical protein V1523DRAFT_393918 [Lipomyces doorenjongii]